MARYHVRVMKSMIGKVTGKQLACRVLIEIPHLFSLLELQVKDEPMSNVWS